MEETFTIGQRYVRSQIHDQYGGGRQSGISPSAQHPYIFIFSGRMGERYGYRDGWSEEEGVFLYTGEGQRGDMTFARGNAAIRDHAERGKDLLLFETHEKGEPVTYLGTFACQSWSTFRGPDVEGAERELIQFHLVRAGEVFALGTGQEEAAQLPSDEPLNILRQRALEAARPQQTSNWRTARQQYRMRSKAVRDYVLARADGRCEFTGEAAPFVTRSGEPYLEAHHIYRLSDDGPDDPRYVAAICPTVHRRIHFGQDGHELNQRLRKIIAAKEAASS
jgi:5-methylcytosine-specific restriction protein A